MNMIKLYDTTLRDGSQMEGISFSFEDKLKIAQRLAELGIHYIEGGWPGSNPKDVVFFKKVKDLKLGAAKITAFGSTRRAGISAGKDKNLKALLEAETETVTIFGKTWDLHVKYALQTTEAENLKMIFDSVKFLKSKKREVIYDAEHFFDGFKGSPDYALKTLQAAFEAGADNISLCDTNGGTLTGEMEEIIHLVKDEIKVPLGIHNHNDSDLAVANSLIAVKNGCVLVQGTINGYGERCGNANLCSIIANLKVKMKINCISDEQLQTLTEVSRYVGEIANMIPFDHQPFVGHSAFAHKAGIHVSAMARHSQTYEHFNPGLVGNERRILVSELSGKTTILTKLKELNVDFSKHSKKAEKILEQIKDLEHQGYQFEGAEASFELLVRRSIGEHKKFFDLEGFRVIVWKDQQGQMFSEAIIKLSVNGQKEHTAAEGDGPVNALDNALRKALDKFYPALKEMSLTDFKVRVISAKSGTAAKVRVFIESKDNKDEWGTVGVSENVIEASWQALVDSIEYKLTKEWDR